MNHNFLFVIFELSHQCETDQKCKKCIFLIMWKYKQKWIRNKINLNMKWIWYGYDSILLYLMTMINSTSITNWSIKKIGIFFYRLWNNSKIWIIQMNIIPNVLTRMMTWKYKKNLKIHDVVWHENFLNNFIKNVFS